MKNSIAIAIARVRHRINASGKGDSVNFGLAISRAWLSILLLAGALFALGAVVCLANGLIRSGGILALLRSWLAAIGG
jgi:hypothetical protein